MLVSTSAVKVRFYVDALNFYYGIAHEHEYGIKWIDMEKLLLSLVREKIPNATAEKIIIFTALVKETPNGARGRQEDYLSALQEHSPCVEIVLGHFKIVHKKGEVVKGYAIGSTATIKTPEEKLTDVNLACRIVEDAYIARENEAKFYDVGCLVSNDSDIAYALDVKQKLKQRIFLITPITKKQDSEKRRRPAALLKKHIPKKDRILTIGKELVATCLLPDTVGKFTKPLKWH